jgi:hypothetical protein
MDSFLTLVTAWLPIRTPIYDQVRRYSVYSEARDKFLKQLTDALPLMSKRIRDVEASLGDPPSEVLDWLNSKSALIGGEFTEYILVTAVVTLDVHELRCANDGREFEPELLRAIVAMEVSGALETVLVLSELAEPGCIDTPEGIAIAEGGGFHSVKSKGSFPSLRFPAKEEPAWPPLMQLDFTAVLRWAGRTSILSSGLAKTRIERALAAYTHVIGLTSHRDGEVLFRAMQALEAFYCDGSGDLRKQLSDKSAIWLGPWSDKRNIVGHLYDLRSKFIHGAAKLEYWISHADAWEEDEDHMQELERGVTFAVRLLLATLQKCIKEDAIDVRWRYSVETSS